MFTHLPRHRFLQAGTWFRAAVIAATVVLLAGPAAAQEESNTRPAGVTFLGDTGLWFVPTAEVMAAGDISGSGQHYTFNREEGFSSIQTSASTFAVGLGGRAELFASVPFVTRIDRDIRPLYRAGTVGSTPPDFPMATQQFSGSALGDVIVGVKVNLMSERTQAPAAIAFRGWARLPTGDESAGTTGGALGGGVGLVLSKAAGSAEIAAHGDFQFRGSPDNITVPHGIRFGIGVGAPVSGPLRLFTELLGSRPLDDQITLRTPRTAHDGSMSGLSLPLGSPLDFVAGLQVQKNGVALGGGITYAVRHASRTTYNQPLPNADRLGVMFRLSYHPGVRVYTPPPPPPPPDPPAPNRPPTVSVSCDPCEVLVNETVNLRADASDPDGDALTYQWNAPTGEFTGGRDRVTTTWQAPGDAGAVPVSVTVSDGNGGSASDTANITVNPEPPVPQRDWVFEDVHFDFDRYTLRPTALEELSQVADAMMEDAALNISIEGHTCNIGTNEYNLALGDRRADAVRSYLSDRGVDVSRLQMVSYGEERPEHDNEREETRRLNRRAALVVRLQ